MNQEKYIGMDVHQATISVAVMDSSGKLIMECILETKAATILEFIDGLRGTLSVTFEEGTPAPEEKPKEFFTKKDVSGSHIGQGVISSGRKKGPKEAIGGSRGSYGIVDHPPKGHMANAGETAIVFIPESDATEHLIYRVEPTFPPLARDASIQGSVVLQIMIGEDGTIQHIKVVSGHPMLVPSAIEAVEKWRYEPFLEDEKPVAVDTRVTVEFSLPKK